MGHHDPNSSAAAAQRVLRAGQKAEIFFLVTLLPSLRVGTDLSQPVCQGRDVPYKSLGAKTWREALRTPFEGSLISFLLKNVFPV